MIRTFDYLKSLPAIEDEVLAAVSRVLHSGRLILGPETEAFEREFAGFVGAAHCVAVSSGTTALHLALMTLGVGVGDEIITVSNTCTPTVAAIRLTGATPVFAEVQDHDLMMDPDRLPELVTERTRCVLPVHLWGYSAPMDRILALTRASGVEVVEDCAQAHGTRFRGAHVGTFGEMGCFSFYPTKNLGAYGDAGAVVTQRSDLAERLRSLRMYGYDEASVSQLEGMNARISEIQAAILRVKLRVLEAWLDRRRSLAAIYDGEISSPSLRLPPRSSDVDHSFHQYVVRSSGREALIDALRAAGIGYGIHYPVPVHLMPGYRFLGGDSLHLPVTVRAAGEILSLPLHEALEPAEARRVATVLNRVAEGRAR